LKAVVRKLGRYRLLLMTAQEVRWDKGGTEPADGYTFSVEKPFFSSNI
jgi:hypothetical protein